MTTGGRRPQAALAAGRTSDEREPSAGKRAGLALLALVLAGTPLHAQTPLHPAFPLLDGQGHVLASGAAVSPPAPAAPATTARTSSGTPSTGGWTPRRWPRGWTRRPPPRRAGRCPRCRWAAGRREREMNCLLCHAAAPNDSARAAALRSGRADWAATATLEGSGLVERTGSGWRWVRGAFDAAGGVPAARLTVHDPADANCLACHGAAHGARWRRAPGALLGPADLGERAEPRRQGHAEPAVRRARRAAGGLRGLSRGGEQPGGLPGVGRVAPGAPGLRPPGESLGEYLRRPATSWQTTARGGGRLQSCHQAEVGPRVAAQPRGTTSRRWRARAATCPELYAPTLESVDWTLLTPAGEPLRRYRQRDAAADPVTGSAARRYRPVLLPERGARGRSRLAPRIPSRSGAGCGAEAEPVAPARLARRALADGG